MSRLYPTVSGNLYFNKVWKRLLLLLSTMVLTVAAMASDFYVTNTNDAGPGSLRQAILDANAAGAGPHSIVFSVRGQVILASSLPAITSKGLTIDGMNRATLNTSGGDINIDFFTIKADSVTIQNFTLLNTGADCFNIPVSTRGVTIRNIVANNYNNSWIDNIVYVYGASTDLTIRNVTSVTGLRSYGFYFRGGKQTNLVMDSIYLSTANNTGASYGLYFIDAALEGWTFTNSNISGVQHAVYMDQYSGVIDTARNVTFDNITVDSLFGGGSYALYSEFINTHITIKNSTFDLDLPANVNDGDYGLYFYYASDNIALDSVRLKDCNRYGISFASPAKDISINHTTVDIPTPGYNSNYGDALIYFASTAERVDIRNTILDADVAGTTDDGLHGIKFYSDITDITLDSLTINECDEDGIYVRLSATSFKLSNSKILNNKDGIEFYNNYARSNVDLANSLFSGSTNSGIRIYSYTATSDVDITGDTVVNSASHGIWLYGNSGVTNDTITGCVVHDNGGAGIFSDYPDNVFITDNAIYNNGAAGISFTNGNCAYTNAAGKTPVLVSSTSLGGGQYELEITVPAITPGVQYEVDIYANDLGTVATSGQYYVTTLTGLVAGTSTHTITYNTGPGATGLGFWTATLRIPANTCGTSEFSNSMAMSVQGPACVNDGIVLWLRADDGVSTGARWNDYSGNALAAIQSAVGSQPAKDKRALNFNDGFVFDGGDFQQIPNNTIKNLFPFGNSARTIIGVGASTATSGDHALFGYGHYSTGANNEFRQSAAIAKYIGWSADLNGTANSLPANKTTIIGGRYNGTTAYLDMNGAENSSNTLSWNTNSTREAQVGRSQYSGYYYWTGSIGEIIVYNRELNADELRQVNSYLSLKYGITMGGGDSNYVASGGTVYWPADATYKYRITGIGKDSCTRLNQKQSLSVDSGWVTIALGDAIMPSNSDNASEFANDKSFLVFADNNGTTAYDVPVSGTAATLRMARVWKVKQTNWADNGQQVTLRVLNASYNNYLLISNDATFATITQAVRFDHNGNVTLDAGLLDNAYFTVGTEAIAPGGVANGLTVWTRADAGVIGGIHPQQWIDQAVATRKWTAAAANTLTFDSAAINYNPAIGFPSNNYFIASEFSNSLTAGDIFSVQFSNRENNYTGTNFPWEFGGYYNNRSYYSYSNTHYTYFGSGNGVRTFTLDARLNLRNAHLLNSWSAPNDRATAFDGKVLDTTGTNTVNFDSYANSNYIGAGHNAVFYGSIAEVILYSRKLNDTERRQVNSYLAIKYGLTLRANPDDSPVDYLASDGTTKMWTAANSSGYAQHITGIGRDDNGFLYQKQSRSADTGIVTIALGSMVAASNADNGGKITNDKSFLVLGDNGADTLYRTAMTGITGLNTRMARIWKAQLTNWADQDITLKIHSGGVGAYLVVSSDDAIGAGDDTYPIKADSTVTISSSLLAASPYFTFARMIKGPNNVNDGIVLWLRADDEVSSNDRWNDYSGNGLIAVQAEADKQPAIDEKVLNFNYGFRFDGSNDYQEIDKNAINGLFPFANTARTVIGVGNSTLASGDALIFAYGRNTNNYATGLRQYYARAIFEGWGYNINGATGSFPANKTTLIGGRYDGTTGYIDVNGMQQAATARSWNTTNTNNAQIGRHIDFARYWNGSIGEIIVYNRALDPAEQRQVYSYLSLKYGITLGGGTLNYVASDGTYYWTADAAVYKNRITGIGRDDTTGLYTRQSCSVDTGIVTIAAGTAVAASNADNTANITNDKSFLVFADDGAATDYHTMVTGVTGVNIRMNRTFKAQLTNWADGNITLQVTGGADAYLLVSSDATFGAGDQVYALDADSTVTINSSVLADNPYFTFAKLAKGPNNVNDGIVMWLRADDGKSNGAQWNDFSGYGNTAVQTTAGSQPVADAKALNFNYGYVLDGSNDYMTIPYDINPANVDPLTVITVYNADVISANNRGIWGNDNGSYDRYMKPDYVSGNNVNQPYTGGNITGTTLINASLMDDGQTDGSYIYINNSEVLKYTQTNSVGGLSYMNLGNWGNSGYFDGKIGEMIVYNRTLSAGEMQSIHSYLSLKYGITMKGGTQDYLASEGTAYWKANTTYKNRITGIGRDDAASLNIKQSRSVDTGFVTIALGSSIALTNEQNAGKITNDTSFLVFADNGESGTAYSEMVHGSTNITRRLPRVWKVDKTNWADQNITLQANATGSDVYLLISHTDPTFATIDEELPLTADKSITLNSSLIPDGAYFTFGANIKYPGGVSGSLLWLRADDGTASGEVWHDYTGNGNDAGQTDAAKRPTVIPGSNIDSAVNFNPMLRFNGTNQNMVLDGTKLPVGTSARTVILLTNKAEISWHTAISWGNAAGSAGNRYSLHLGGGQRLLDVASSAFGNRSESTEIPGITTFINAANTKNSDTRIWVSGKSVTNENLGYTAYTLNTTSAATAYIGNDVYSSAGSARYYKGLLGEVVVYGNELTTEEQQRVESYLSIKYGITLNNGATDYLATDGSTIWSTTTNTGYNNNIAGIGYDNAEDLNQKQSRSINEGTQVAIGLGDLADDNLSNTNAFTANRSYMLWGDDGASTLFKTALSGHAIVNYRMTRIWKVQETTAAPVGDVQIAMPYDVLPNAQESYLIVSDDATLDGTDDFYSLTEIMLNGVKYYAATVDVANGQYFSFGSYIKAPGGVVGTSLWLRADAGTSSTTDGANVNGWTDYASDLNNVTQSTTGSQPLYLNNGTDNINFNPVMKFDGGDIMLKTKGILGTASYTGTAQFMISQRLGITSARPFWQPTTASALSLGVPYSTSSAYFYYGPTYITGSGLATAADLALPNLYAGVSSNTPANTQQFLVNNTSLANAAATPSYTGNESDFGIGGQPGSASYYFNGLLPELIIYNNGLTDTEVQRIQTYLAIKYGITLNQATPYDYLATDGTTKVWDATANAVYKNNITGIGLDEVEGLNQKQSRSINPGFQPTIGLGSIAASNLANNNNFTADRSYLVWGDDSATTTFGTAITGKPGINYRMDRVWKVQETGTVGTVQVAVPKDSLPANATSVFLVVSADATFDGSDDFIPLSETDVNGVTSLTGSTDLANGDHFTFAAFVVGPGGVVPGLSAWFTTTNGITAADGAKVDNWQNSASGTYHLSQATDARRPLYYNSTADQLVNFNPSVSFDGTDDYLSNLTPLMPGTSSYTFMAVARDEDAGTGYRNLFSAQRDRNIFGLFKQGGATANNGWAPYGTGGNPNRGPMGKGTKYSPAGGSNGFWNGTNFTSDATTQRIQPQIVGFMSQNSATTDPMFTWVDGYMDNPGWSFINESLTARTNFFNTFHIGANANSTAYQEVWKGKINEVISYSRVLTDVEAQQVNTYLAIKWGISLGQGNGAVANNNNNYDYLASNGTTKVWDATANSAYKYNIAGIGKDIMGGLDQRQSRSVNTGAILTVGRGAIEATNADNTNTFAKDSSYFLWGSNSAATTVTGTDLPPTCIQERLTQEWKVQATNFDNAAQSLTLAFDLSGITRTGTDLAHYALLVDKTGSGDFASLSTADYQLIPATALNGDIVTFDNVTTLTNGAVFTLVTRNAATPVAELVPDNTETITASVCLDSDGWLYFKDPADPDKYLAAIDPNGNTLEPSGFSATISVNKNMDTELGANSGTDYGVQLMRRLLQIDYTGTTPLTQNGGVKVRLLWDAAERTNAEDYLSATRGITATPTWTWFKRTGTVADVISNLSAAGLAGMEPLTPTGTGTADGVAYVEFEGIQEFSVFGGLASATNVISVIKDTDGNEAGPVDGKFIVKLPGTQQATEDITVDYEISGTATNEDDYTISGLDNTALTGTAIIPAGSNSVEVLAAVIDEEMIENAETIHITLTAAAGAANTYSLHSTEFEAEATITDDDNTAANRVVTATASVTTALEDGPVNGEFTFSLPAGITSGEPVTLTYSLGAGTAAYGDDYTLTGYDEGTNTGTITIPAGQNSVTLVVTVQADNLLENDETVILDLASPVAGTTTTLGDFTPDAAAGSATVTIEDDNDPSARYLQITRVTDGYETAPAGSSTQDAVFRVSLPSGILSSEDITITYDIDAASTAAYTNDYSIATGFTPGTMTGTVVIPAGSNAAEVTLVVVDDDILESDETIVVNLQDGNGGAYPANPDDPALRTTTLKIFDDDRTDPNKTKVTVTATQAAAVEDPAAPVHGEYTIGLPSGITAGRDITVTFSIGGEAQRDTDYELRDAADAVISGTTVTIPAGQNSITIAAHVLDDQIIEGDEDINMTLGNATATGLTLSVDNAPATVTIADDDDVAANLQLGITATQDGAEPTTGGLFTVSLPAGMTASRDITVTYTFDATNSTAVSGTDFSALSGTVKIPAGQNGATIAVNVINNNVIDGTRTVKVDLAATAGTDGVNDYVAAAAPDNTATVNITDEDYNANSNVLLLTRVSDAVEGGARGQFQVSLPTNVTSTRPITATYTLSGTAVEGTDFTLVSAPHLNTGTLTITIPAGQNSVIIEVNAVDDGAIESTETTILELTSAQDDNGNPYTINPASASVNILDVNGTEENQLVISNTGDLVEPGTHASFTIGIKTGNTYSVPIDVSIAVRGTATQGVDYQAIGAVTIPAGQSFVTLPLSVMDDHILESTENIEIELLGGNSVEATPRSFPADPAAANNNIINVNVEDDDNTSANRTLELVKVNDGAEPGTNGSFTIQLPEYAAGQRYTSAVLINVTIDATGTAGPGVDYNNIGTSAAIAAGQSGVVIPVSVQDDDILEGTETVILTMTDAAATYGGTTESFTLTGPATVNITDDEATAGISFTDVDDAYEDGTSGGYVRFALTGNSVAGQDVTVNFSVLSAGSTAGNNDYTLDYTGLGGNYDPATHTGTVIIPAGQNAVQLPVRALEDLLVEGQETLVFRMDGATTTYTGGGAANLTIQGTAQRTVNIIDETYDMTITAIKHQDGAEAGTDGVYRVHLGGYGTANALMAAQDITITYTVQAASTATAGADYTTLSGSVIIPAGQNYAEITVPVLPDNSIEGNETVIIRLQNAASSVSYTVSTQDVTLTITDDDNTPANRELSATVQRAAAEPGAGTNNGIIRISLPAGITATEDITVNYELGLGTATYSEDYTISGYTEGTNTGTVVIPAGQSFVNVPVVVVNDYLIEGSENLSLHIIEGTTTMLGDFTPHVTNGSVTLAISDDDDVAANRVVRVVKTDDGDEAAPTDGNFRFSLPVISGNQVLASEDVTINYTISGTAKPGASTATDKDYAELSGTVTIAAGSGFSDVPVNVIDNSIIDGTRTVIVTISNITTASGKAFTAHATENTATVNIADDDNTTANRTLAVTAPIPDAQEAASPVPGVFTISLPAGISVASDLQVSFILDGDAVNGTDYQNISPLTVTIPAGHTSADVSIVPINNNIIDGDRDVTLTVNSITVTGGNPYGAFTASPDNATLTIHDDDDTPDNRQVSVTASTADGYEDPAAANRNAVFTVGLPGGLTAAEPLTVSFTLTGTAMNGMDYQNISPLTVTIPAGQNSATVTAIPVDNILIDGNRSVILTVDQVDLPAGSSLQPFSPAAAPLNQATATIHDDDAAKTALSITASTAAAAEPGTNGVFTISLPAGVTAGEDITVTYTINAASTAQHGTAADTDKDYVTLSGTAVIPAGDPSITVPVQVIDNNIIDGNRTVIVTLSGGTTPNMGNIDADPAASEATVTIADDDAAKTELGITASTAAAAEPGTNGMFTVSLPAGVTAKENITVTYTVNAASTAQPGAATDTDRDYVTLSGTALIPAGNPSVTIPVQVIDNNIIDGSRSVIVTLSGGTTPTVGSIAVNTAASEATVTIADDDAAKTKLSIVAATPDADEDGPVNGTFSISLPAGVTAKEDITVTYTLNANSTAQPGAATDTDKDYVTLSGTVLIPAGASSATVPVQVIDNIVIDGNRTVILTLNGGMTATMGSIGVDPAASEATVIIADNDLDNAQVEIVAATPDAAEPATNGAFTIRLANGQTTTVDIDVSFTIAGTSLRGTDYTLTNAGGTAITGNMVTIPAGSGSVALTVRVDDDDILEQAETVEMTLQAAQVSGMGNAAVPIGTSAAATVTIDDDDNTTANRTLSIAGTTDAAEQGADGGFTISLPAGISSSEDVTVSYTISGTAADGADYTSLSGTVVIPAGQNSVVVPVIVTDDQVIENTETIVLTVTGGTAASFTFTAGSGSTGTVNITDNDNTAAARTLGITKVTDGAEPGSAGSFSISLPTGVSSAQDITVTYTISGTATSGADYAALSGTAVIPADQNSVTVAVDVLDDPIIESTETVVLTVTGGTSTDFTFTPGSSGNSATVNIIDEDGQPANLVLNAAKVADGAEPGSAGSFSIHLPAGVNSAEDVTVSYTISGTATAGADYTAPSGTAVIPAGQQSVTVSVPVQDDNIIEAAETVVLTVTGGSAGDVAYTAGPNSTATITIADDDNTPANLVLSVSKTADAEEPATNGAFTISLPAGIQTSESIAIQYMIGGTATPDADYSAITGTISIPAGAGSVTVPVEVLDDREIEAAETVVFTLTGGQSASYTFTAGTPQDATVTIVDTDVPSGDLVVTKEVVQPAVGPYRMGQDITYRITVKNIGNIAANDTKVRDSLPVQLDLPTHTSAERGQVNVFADSKVVEWGIGDLEPNGTVQMTLTSRVMEGGQLVNRAVAVADGVDADSTNNTGTSSIMIDGQDLYFPNALTPNGDGKNEQFIIGGLEKYPGSGLYIFNRWGSMVYQSKDYRNDWRGSDLNEGTYYYILEVKKPDGIRKYKGWITILR